MKDSDLPKGRPVVPAAEPEPKVIFDADVATGDAVNLCMISPGVWRASKIKPAEPEYPVMERLHGPPTLESRVAALEAQMAALTVAPTVQPDLTVEPEWHRRPDEITDDRKRVWVVDVYQKIVAFLDEDDGVWLVYANLYGHDFLLYRGNARHAELIVRLCSRIPEVLL